MTDLVEIINRLSDEEREIVIGRLKQAKHLTKALQARFKMVHDLVVDVMQAKTLDSLIGYISQRVAGSRFPYDSFTISFVEDTAGVPTLVAKDHYNPNLTAEERRQAIEDYQIPLNEDSSSIGRKAVLEARTIYHKIRPGEEPKLKNKGMAAYVTAPLKDNEGHVIGTIALGKKKANGTRHLDIQTAEEIAAVVESAIERIRYTDNLRSLKNKFQLLADKATSLIFWQRPDGTFEYISPSCEKVLGYSQEDFYKGLRFEDMLPGTGSSLNIGDTEASRNAEYFRKMYDPGDPKHPRQKFKAKMHVDGNLSHSDTGYVIEGGNLALASLEYDVMILDRQFMGIAGTIVNETRSLGNLIPICASCHSVRDDTGVDLGKGKWVNINTYLADLGAINLSHGLCMPCAKKLYGDFVKE
ncbi:MAG: GAF domain-containing protein [Nanoarchaeota archaeon]|nr:GAF domain-containing protein [Nanoarchaeota archaeon]